MASDRTVAGDLVAALAKRPEYLFLLLGSVFGLLFMVLTPPFQVPDEAVHFYRAYEISEGRFIPAAPEGPNGAAPSNLPRALGEAAGRFNDIPFHTENRTSLAEIAAADLEIDAEDRTPLGTAIHPWMSYAPQVLGVLLARLLGLGVVATLYAGRLFALVFWLFAVFMAVRMTPIGKLAFMAVSLLPVMVFVVPSFSADSFTYSMIALAVAFALRCATRDEPLSARQIAGVLLLSLVVSLLKPPYSLLFLVFLVIPVRNLKGGRNSALIVAAVLAACVAIALSWLFLVQPGATPDRTDVLVSPALQLQSAKRDPMTFVVAVIRSYLSFTGVRLALRVTTLGWNDTNQHVIWPMLAWGAVVWSFATTKNALSKLGPLVKLAQAAVLILVFMAINGALYISTNEVGSMMPIGGLQIRYLLPLVVSAIPIAAMRRRLVFNGISNQGVYLGGVHAAVLAASAYALYVRYFVGTW